VKFAVVWWDVMAWHVLWLDANMSEEPVAYIVSIEENIIIPLIRAFFLGGRRGTRTLKHFVNLTGESKNFKIFYFLLNQLQTYYG
jgi:hypothetical protein